MLLHPFMLAWLAGASVPLVLHLLSRSQYRAVPWGAMMFLTGADAGPRYAARIKQWILLLLRMSVVGLLAVALARPVISSRYAAVPTAGLTLAGPAAVVIILDDSASMGYQANGKSRLDQAREVTLQILGSLKRGDQAALLLAGTRGYQTPVPPSADLQSIAGRVADLQPDTGESDFATEMLRAADLLEHAGPADHEIYLICDRQALSWRSVTDAFRQQWIARGRIASLPRITVIPVGDNEADNLAVEGIEFPDHAAIRDQPANVQVRIHNYGPAPARSVQISVWSGARTFGEMSATVPAHGTTIVNAPVRFMEAGSKIVSAAVKSTGLTTDDRLDCAVDVVDVPQVLIVTREKESPATQPTEQIPMRRGSQSTFVAVNDLNADQLKKCNVVILEDIAVVTEEQMKYLKGFVSGGGSILLLPGQNTTADDYNKSLCGKNGVMPVALHPPALKPSAVTNIDRQQLLFRAGPPNTDLLKKLTLSRVFPVNLLNSETRILARTNQGNPFLLESVIGEGRVMMLTADDVSATALLMSPLVRYLGTRAAVDRNIWLGQPIVAVTTDPVEDRSATVQYVSGGPREPAYITHLPGKTEIRFTKSNRPGIYRLRYRTGGKEKVLSYVVNTNRSESDLTPLTEDQWKTLARRVNFDRLDLSQTSVAAALDLQRDGREIWIDLLAAVLFLMCMEMLLSRWWSVSPG